jgi:hypothetical protein
MRGLERIARELGGIAPLRSRPAEAPNVTCLAADRIVTTGRQPYIDRYRLVFGMECWVRFHYWLGSDDPEALYGYPWVSRSLVVAGVWLSTASSATSTAGNRVQELCPLVAVVVLVSNIVLTTNYPARR